jgi:hypothetical protein
MTSCPRFARFWIRRSKLRGSTAHAVCVAREPGDPMWVELVGSFLVGIDSRCFPLSRSLGMHAEEAPYPTWGFASPR